MSYKIGVIAGCFDLIHPGYIRMFSDAKNVCDKLLIALHEDPSEERPEIKHKPIHSISERIEILRAIKYVDSIFTYCTEKELYELLKISMANLRILGSDYKNTQYNGHDLDMEVYFHKRDHNYSTTSLRRKICEQL